MVGLIVAGVVLFLLADAFILYKVITRHRSADDAGAFAIPGSTQVMLQPGKVRLTYTEARRAESDEHTIYFSKPDGVRVTVTSPSGQELEIKAPGIAGMGASRSVGLKSSRDVVGTVEVTETGLHTITADGDAGPEAVEPRLLIG